MPYQARKDEFNQLLRERRLKKYQVAFRAAEMVGTEFTNILNGKRLLAQETAQKFADYLQVPIGQLFVEVEGRVRGRPRVDGIGKINREVVAKARERLNITSVHKLLMKIVKLFPDAADTISPATFTLIMGRDRAVEADIASKIAAALEVTVEELISEESKEFQRSLIVSETPRFATPPVRDIAELPSFLRQYTTPEAIAYRPSDPPAQPPKEVWELPKDPDEIPEELSDPQDVNDGD